MSTKLAGLPFSGPIGATRMAHIDGQWVAFPTHDELARATFDMVVAGRTLPDGDVAIMMVEAEATEHTVEPGRRRRARADRGGRGQRSGGREAGHPRAVPGPERAGRRRGQADRRVPGLPGLPGRRVRAVADAVRGEVGRGAQDRRQAGARRARWTGSRTRPTSSLDGQFEGREKEISAAFRSVTKKEVRARVLRDQVRIDGRGPRDIRPLTAEVGVLPRVHGTALFERGETQILGVTTLNMLRMEQALDTLSPEKSKRYMHNYNFPPYSTGETGRVGSPKRREIGHGALAERALIPVLPAREEFPYAIRQVSEALGSNGSTSMGSVCACTMSLLYAGVPLKAPVAGIAMGLISDEVDGKTSFVTLTDILGAEDAFGDMDFKVAGTPDFVTALQLDTKLDGIPSDVLAAALAAGARRPAHHPRRDAAGDRVSPATMSDYAPRVTTVKIPVDKIGMVIGPKGQTINAIQDETGAEISIEDDGTIYVGATNGPSAAGRGRPDQRDRQPDDAEGRRPVPRHRGEDGRVRRVRLAAARPRRPAAHLQGGRRQAGRAGRGLPQRRRQGRGADRRDRRPRARSTWTRCGSEGEARARGRLPDRATGTGVATVVRVTAATAIAATVARAVAKTCAVGRGRGEGDEARRRRRRQR